MEQDDHHAIYGKKCLKIFFCRTKKALRLNLGIKHWGLKVYQIYANDDPRMTYDLFKAKSNLHPHTFIWGKVKKSFSQNVLKTNG